METMEAIKGRRSIRSYSAEPVNDEQVELLIEAAMYAPSAGNEQPWEFIIIDSREMLDRIAAEHEHAQMVGEAPVAVLICGVMERVKHGKMWVQDCAAATQNFMLAAHDQGLGTCWIGVYPRPEREKLFYEMLDLPEEVVPFSLISLGKPAADYPEVDRFKPERIHKNSWPG